MEKESLKILVIEDNEEYMRDAKRTFDFLLKKGAPVEFHYTETLKEANELMAEITFDGVITDVFFPYDEKTRDDNIPGWDYATAAKCRKHINLPDIYEDLKSSWEWNEDCRRNHERLKGEGHYTRPKEGYTLGEWLLENTSYKNETLRKHNTWMEGKTMHPSGMLVALECAKKNIPFKFETDQTGHGSLTEAVFKTVSSKFKIHLFNLVHHARIKRVKKWYLSYSSVIAQIWKKRGGLLEERKINGTQEQYDYIQHMRKYCASTGVLGKPSSRFSKEESEEENESIKRNKEALREIAKNEKEVIDYINS